MKNKLFYLPLISLSLSLTACPFSLLENDEWKDKFGTPELLLQNASINSHVYLYEEDNCYLDEDYAIRNALIEASPYAKTQKSKTKEERYFTYEAKIVPATSGPNYEHLLVYESGLVIIHHKASLGAHKYLYFSLPKEKASYLNDLVFSILEKGNN